MHAQDEHRQLRPFAAEVPQQIETAGAGQADVEHHHIPVGVEHFVQAFNQEFRREVAGVEPDALAALAAYGWPGNVRELRNAVERAMILAAGERLTLADFPNLGASKPVTNGFRLPAEGVQFEELERDLVIQALERTGGNQTRAAALLGMNRDQIRYRIEKFGLPVR